MATKTLVDRIRLGRNLSSPIEGAGDEYGNYKKFESNRNKVEEVNDKGYTDRGHDTFAKNVESMLETMRSPQQAHYRKEREDLDKMNVE